ncbi:MAG: phosphatase PAP2 family protein [Gemmatimonadetes bacterium]|nr:phosphatase PAP2 family protein [Gemmatimonadota bacterium]
MTRLRPVDILVLAYVGIVSAVALARAPGSSGTWWLLTAHALIVILVALVNRPGLGRTGTLLREIYPLVLLGSLYGALDILNRGRGTDVFDQVVMGWEAALFGGQISRDWWRGATSPFWSTVLHGAYLTYYVIIPLPPLYFAVTNNRAALRRSVFLIMTAFILSYLFFVFFPVAGPYYQFERPAGEFVANPMARTVYGILATGSSYGAAFPSSHVAATVAAVVAAWWGAPLLGLVLTLPTVLLTIGVVYTQMHYGVDVIAGLVIAGLAVALTVALEKRTSPGAGRRGRVETAP